MFAGYELAHSQSAAGESEIDNFKPYSDIPSEDSDFSGTTKSEQYNNRISGEAKHASSTSERYSHNELFDANMPKQNSYSCAGSQQHNVKLSRSTVKSETVHIPIPMVTKQDNLVTSVLSTKDVKPAKLKVQMEQRVCINLFWICYLYHIQKF